MRKSKDVDMQKELKESAHKIWLAGLGALAAAGEESKTLFSNLVERGQELESRSMHQVDKVKGRMKDAKTNAGALWDKVAEGFDGQVASALHRLGVPTRDEIANLTARVEELTKSIEKARKPAAAPRKRTAEAKPAE